MPPALSQDTMIRPFMLVLRIRPQVASLAAVLVTGVMAGCASDEPITAARQPASSQVVNVPHVSLAGIKTMSPAGAVKANGPWAVGTRAGDFIFVAGMRGIDPRTNQLVHDDEGRVRQAFLNMKDVAQSEGASLKDVTRIVVYVTNMARLRPLLNKVQSELWGQGPYPPRTIIEVRRLNQDDIVEVEGTFYVPASR